MSGFIGPLTEVDQDRCPFCGLHPLDPTLHADDCRTVTEGLCGVIQVGSICMAPEHMPPRTVSAWDPAWWKTWTDGHQWVALDRVPSTSEGEGA